MADRSSKTRIDWTAAPFVFLVAATCHYCGSPRLKRQRTTGSNGEGGIERLVICLDCGEGNRVLEQFPIRGNDGKWIATKEAEEIFNS